MRGKVTGHLAGHFFCAGRMAFPPVSENLPRTAQNCVVFPRSAWYNRDRPTRGSAARSFEGPPVSVR